MQFKDVIGQDQIKTQLLETLHSGRVSHAQLFAGKTGYGSLALALAYAQYVFCTGHKGDDACGECQSCRQMQKLIHPDLHLVFPVVKQKSDRDTVSDDFITEWRTLTTQTRYYDISDWYRTLRSEDNKQCVIYEAESGNILRKLNIKSFESDYKIMLIWLPERMNRECANKLLKILEEPYEKTLFLLVSEQPEILLSTIQSRVQRINILPIAAEAIEHQLIKTYHLTQEQAIEYARVASGDWHRAEQLLNAPEEETTNFENFVNLMRLCWTRQMLPVNEWVEKLTKSSRESQKTFIAYCLRMLRESFSKNFHSKELTYMTDREENFTNRFAPFVNENNIIQLSDEFERAYTDINRNGNAKIIFTDLCIKVMQNIRPN